MDFYAVTTSVKFNNSYEDMPLFNNDTDKKEYFDLDNLFNNSIKINFNFGNFLTTTLTYRPIPILYSKILSDNYCIVKQVDGVNVNYYYYFINRKTYDSNNQWILDIELDVITNFYDKIEFNDCMIYRANINRVVKKGNYYSYDFRENSKFFIPEKDFYNIATFVKNKKSININRPSRFVNAPNDLFVYFYFKKKMYKINNEEFYLGYNSLDIENIYGSYMVCVAPLKRKILKYNGNEYRWGAEDVFTFIKDNDGETNLLSIKISSYFPFNENYPIQSYGTLGIKGYEITENVNNIKVYNDTHVALTFVLNNPNAFVNYINIDDIIKSNFSDNEFQNENKNINPKLYTNCCTFNITNGIDNFVIEPSKILGKANISEFRVDYFETLSPDITRYKITIYNSDIDNFNIPYNRKINNTNISSFIGSVDNSIPYSTNQLETFLANNKNFYQQRSNTYQSKFAQLVVSLASGLAQTITKGAYGDIKGAIISGAQASETFINSQLSMSTNYANSELSLDNMLSAPEILQNANGNIEILYNTNNFQWQLLYCEPTNFDKERYNDNVYRFGFTLGFFDNPKKYDKNRERFNYIKFNPEIIEYNGKSIDRQIQNKLKVIFNNGIRFWNKGYYNFEYGRNNEVEVETVE